MEMEMRGSNMIRALAMVGLFAGVIVGQPTAGSFKDCYIKCFIFCVITPNNSAFSCSLQCLKDCVIPSHSHHLDHLQPTHHSAADTTNFCNLGCASSLCTNLSTKNNPAGEEVERCVNSCSNKCEDYHPPPSKTHEQLFSSERP